jgi:hypothetical protein
MKTKLPAENLIQSCPCQLRELPVTRADQVLALNAIHNPAAREMAITQPDRGNQLKPLLS